MDYYELLQVDTAATFDQIHKAYRSLALRYHPDRNSTPGASSMMSSINEAYSVLSEPARRKSYDEQRARTPLFDMAGFTRAMEDTFEKMSRRWGSA